MEDNTKKYASLLKQQKFLLYEKLIFEHYYHRIKDEEEKQNFNDNIAEYINKQISSKSKIPLLTLEQKYNIIHDELISAHVKWETFEKRKDERTDELLAKNQEIIQNIKDIKMEVYELNRKIDTQNNNKIKNGKISYDLLKDYFEEKFKKLDIKIKGEREKLKKFNKDIIIMTKKLEKKDSNNELQFIDFHQLQIENKNLVKTLDTKNKALLKLKMNSGKTTNQKIGYNKKLKNEISHKYHFDEEKKINLDKKIKLKNLNEKQNNFIEKRNKETNLLYNKITKGVKLKSDDHVKIKKIENGLKDILDNLNKKLSIEKIKDNNSKININKSKTVK